MPSFQGILQNQRREDVFMQSMIKELYYGNIRPDSKFYKKDSPFMKATHIKRDCMEKLTETLNDSEKALLDKYCEAQLEVDSIVDFDTFAYALRFGILFMVDIFTDNNE